jgi:hypothetical protein
MEGLTQRLIACVRDSCQKYDIKKHDYIDNYNSLTSEQINRIRKNYKVIDVDWLS